MNPFIEALIWTGLLAAVGGLAWVYGSSWRAVARALAEAQQPADAGETPQAGAELGGRISAVLDPPASVAAPPARLSIRS
jgi:hypothetical protein